MLETALHGWHADHSARLVEFAGWHMPIQYSSIVDEHHAVRRAAGLFDIAHMGRLWFTGPEQIALLDFLLTNSVQKMADGQVRYSLVCRDNGGILDDVLIYRFEEDCLLVVNASNREKIVDWIRQYQNRFQADMVDRTLSSFMLALQGPAAVQILQPHIDTDLASLRYYRARKTHVFGVPAVVSRTGYTGEDGFEIIVEQADAVSIWQAVFEAGQSAGLLPCGLGCRDTLRMESAMPLYGHEMDESIDPFTASLAFGVALNKPEFIGQPALQELSQRTDLPRRVGLRLEGKRIARQGAEVFCGTERVGIVTSGTFSPTLEYSLAMASVTPQAAGGTQPLEIDIRGRREPAQLVSLPFYKRS